MTTLINGNTMFCTNCKGEFYLILPMSITEFVIISKAFTRLHKGCSKNFPDSELKKQNEK